ncbi:MAG: potassium channel family protein [Pseudomonadota bacterium]|nr:potassium channel family protein [Pseudomonadota bacterium]
MSLPLRQGYQYLLGTLLALTVLYPLQDEFEGGRLTLGIILTVVMVTAVVSVARKRYQFIVSLLLAIAFIAMRNAAMPDNTGGVAIAGALAGSLFFFYVGVILLFSIFEKRDRVDPDLIYGAISVYLLVGFAFAYLCLSLETAGPGAFANILDRTGESNDMLPGFVYYSFVTLTTLGFGDVVPVTRPGEVLAYVEAIAGQLYLTVLVARLVGIHLSQQNSSGN